MKTFKHFHSSLIAAALCLAPSISFAQATWNAPAAPAPSTPSTPNVSSSVTSSVLSGTSSATSSITSSLPYDSISTVGKAAEKVGLSDAGKAAISNLSPDLNAGHIKSQLTYEIKQIDEKIANLDAGIAELAAPTISDGDVWNSPEFETVRKELRAERNSPEIQAKMERSVGLTDANKELSDLTAQLDSMDESYKATMKQYDGIQKELQAQADVAPSPEERAAILSLQNQVNHQAKEFSDQHFAQVDIVRAKYVKANQKTQDLQDKANAKVHEYFNDEFKSRFQDVKQNLQSNANKNSQAQAKSVNAEIKDLKDKKAALQQDIAKLDQAFQNASDVSDPSAVEVASSPLVGVSESGGGNSSPQPAPSADHGGSSSPQEVVEVPPEFRIQPDKNSSQVQAKSDNSFNAVIDGGFEADAPDPFIEVEPGSLVFNNGEIEEQGGTAILVEGPNGKDVSIRFNEGEVGKEWAAMERQTDITMLKMSRDGLSVGKEVVDVGVGLGMAYTGTSFVAGAAYSFGSNEVQQRIDQGIQVKILQLEHPNRHDPNHSDHKAYQQAFGKLKKQMSKDYKESLISTGLGVGYSAIPGGKSTKGVVSSGVQEGVDAVTGEAIGFVRGKIIGAGVSVANEEKVDVKVEYQPVYSSNSRGSLTR